MSQSANEDGVAEAGEFLFSLVDNNRLSEESAHNLFQAHEDLLTGAYRGKVYQVVNDIVSSAPEMRDASIISLVSGIKNLLDAELKAVPAEPEPELTPRERFMMRLRDEASGAATTSARAPVTTSPPVPRPVTQATPPVKANTAPPAETPQPVTKPAVAKPQLVGSGNLRDQAPDHPAVPVENSVDENYIVCLEDGTRHKVMKRYLKRVYGLSGEEYKERWNLPDDYPLVCANYSKKKSATATEQHKNGELGRKKGSLNRKKGTAESTRPLAVESSAEKKVASPSGPTSAEGITSETRKPMYAPGKLVPAVPIEDSITPDYIVSLEDGSRHRLLAPHLRKLNLTKDEYLKRWNLPAEYPMTAPNLTAQKKSVASRTGLGRQVGRDRHSDDT